MAHHQHDNNGLAWAQVCYNCNLPRCVEDLDSDPAITHPACPIWQAQHQGLTPDEMVKWLKDHKRVEQRPAKPKAVVEQPGYIYKGRPVKLLIPVY